jgi:hypothetical protein
VDTDDVLKGVRRRSIWVIIAAVAGAAVAIIVTALRPPQYEAAADVVIGQVSQSLRYGPLRVDPLEDPEVVLRYVRSPAFHRGVQEEVDETAFSLAANLVRTPKNEPTRYMQLRATAPSAAAAREAAGAAAGRLVARHSRRYAEWMRLSREHEETLQQQIARLEQSLTGAGETRQLQALSLGSWLESRGKELSELLALLRDVRMDTHSEVRSESTTVVGPVVVVSGARPWARTAVFGFIVGAVVSGLVLGGLEAKRRVPAHGP